MRDAHRTQLGESVGNSEWLMADVQRLTTDAQTMMTLLGSLTGERYTESTERDAARAAVETVTVELDAARTEFQTLQQQTEASVEPRRDVDRTIAQLSRDMPAMERRHVSWYRDLRDVVTRARFAVRSAVRMMIRGTWSRADRLTNELDRSMGDIVSSRDVPGLMDNDVYEVYEELVP